ncbi:MAG: hypothetical protein ABR94_02795 [Sphingobacteriales bacterium BACL12 MAG-120802-bin5]|jgi:hypothetical protein|nr:MAG: hypothetical protein ABR94_02795 [Sphingobacteriales bacterium BACL12 MAG-120802-bin5]
MKRIFSLIATVVIAGSLTAQIQVEPRISLVAAMGDYNLNYDKAFLFRGAAAAATGFGMGADVTHPIGLIENMDVFGSMDIFYNGLAKDLKADLQADAPDAAINYNSYVNIPLMAGIKYYYVIPDIYLKTYVKGGIGLNTLFISDLGFEQPDLSQTFSFKPSVAGAATFGLGVILAEKYTVGFEFMHLGNHTPKGEMEEIKQESLKGFDISDTFQPEELPVRTFRLTAGFLLF